MSHNNNSNDAPFMMFGAILLMLAIGSIVIKALKQFFIELGQSFEAFAGMMGSFTLMLWNMVQVVFLIALIIATVFCAIYFTIQYYKMVKDGTALRDWVQSSIAEFQEKILNRFESFENEVSRDIQNMDRRLTDALKKPEVAPTVEAKADSMAESQTPTEVNSDVVEVSNDSQPDGLGVNAGDEELEEMENQSDTKTQEVTMSNPY